MGSLKDEGVKDDERSKIMKKILILVLLVFVVVACGKQTPPMSATPTLEPTEQPDGVEPTAVEPTQERLSEPEPVEQSSGSDFPLAPITNDEGGPVVVTGEWDYTSAYVGRHYTEPVAVLLNMSHKVQGNYKEWVPRSGQIMGFLTRPLAPSPTAYEVNIPVQPTGASADLDNDGQQDSGVQLYAAVIGSNISSDSYLEQVEQDGFTSYLSDPQTDAIREGAFLVYAPDDQQGFPGSAGEDGIFFTTDDPVVGLPSGYTLVKLSLDGQVSFDRSREVSMNILEAAAYNSPDFSDQGILESYNSLIDLLKERYSYTELRGLDWEQIRQEYLPRVQAANEAEDFPAYYLALNEMALSIEDAHVYLHSSSPLLPANFYAKVEEAYGGSLGAKVVELSDGRFVVTYMDPEGPGAQAGWQIGTEIVRVDGVPIGERVDALPLVDSTGNPEVIRLKKTDRALAFPVGTETTIEYRQPEQSDLNSITLTAVEGEDLVVPKPPVEEASISYKQFENGAHYIQWKGFDDELFKIANWEKFLSVAQGSPGVIIDLRENVGGSVALLYTLASYLFTAEEPAEIHWFDSYVYDEKVGDLVKEFSTDYKLSSPKPELTFTGAVVVLVGEGSASAAEYFPQFLQHQGRAIAIGEHSTEGAGGFVETAKMPGDFTFNFTKGRTYFSGTDELNLEAKGVTLDVRVPVTLENELAKQEGRDVVLEAAFEALGKEAARLTSKNLPGTSWELLLIQDAVTKSNVDDPTAYVVTFNEAGRMTIQADCNLVNADYMIGDAGALTITVGPSTLAACPEGSLSEKFLQLLSEVVSFQTDGKNILLTANQEGGVALLMLQRAE